MKKSSTPFSSSSSSTSSTPSSSSTTPSFPSPSFSSSDDRTLLQFAQLQARRGDMASARSLFRAATVAAPSNPFICVAWARAEARCCISIDGDAAYASSYSSSSSYSSFDAAIEILEAGAKRCGGLAATFAKGGALLREWAALEARRGNIVRARELFRAGSRSGDALLLTAWADFERELLLLEEGAEEWREGEAEGEDGGEEGEARERGRGRGDPVAAREAAMLAEEAARKEDEARRRV